MKTTPEPEEQTPAAPLASRLNRAFGPVAAGVMLDLLDLTTFGPVGLLIGLPVGAAMGWWMASALGVEKQNRRWFALAAAVYCTIPFTEVLPLATLAGAYVRFKQSDRDRNPTGIQKTNDETPQPEESPKN